MRFLGAKVVLTPAAERGIGMVDKAVELAETHGWFLTRQFENEANADMHSRTTAREIVDDFAGERLDYWVTGYGTGGTLKGVARVLREGAARDQDRRLRAGRRAAARQRHRRRQRNPDGSPAGRPSRASSRTRCRAGARTSSRSSPATPSTSKVIDRIAADRRRRRDALQPGAGAEGGHLRRHHRRRHLRRRAAGVRGGAEGRDHPRACCPTPASAISARRCSPTFRPT